MASAFDIARYDWSRLVGGLKAKLLLGAYCVWTALPAVARVVMRGDVDDLDRRSQALALVHTYNMGVAKYLTACPDGLILLSVMVFWLTPVFTLLLSFDRVAGDVESRTARLVLTRVSRPGFVAGKALATWGVFSVVSSVVFVAVAAAEIAVGPDSPRVVVGWAAELYAYACAIAAVYIGVWMLLSSSCKTSRTVLFAGLGTLIALFVLRAFARQSIPELARLLPGSMDELVLSGNSELIAQATAIGAVWCLATLAAAAGVLRLRSI